MVPIVNCIAHADLHRQPARSSVSHTEQARGTLIQHVVEQDTSYRIVLKAPAGVLTSSRPVLPPSPSRSSYRR